jgi:hypothetical protein
MSSNLERTNTVYYELFTRILGTKKIQEPKGYNSDRRSLERDKDSKGITIKTEVDLEFYGEAATFLATIFRAYGVQEKVLLTKYEKNVNTLDERWGLRYVQELDMTSFKEDAKDGKVSVKATEGGLYDDIKNRIGEDYDLISEESADGKPIGKMDLDFLFPTPRKIYVESLLEARNVSDYRINTEKLGSGAITFSRTIPMELTYSSDKDDVYEPNLSRDSYNNDAHPRSSDVNGDLPLDSRNAFLYRAEIPKSVRVKLDFKFRITEVEQKHANNKNLRVKLKKYRLTTGFDINNDVLEQEWELLNIGNPASSIGVEHIIPTYEEDIFLLKDESLTIEFELYAELGEFLSKGEVNVHTTCTTRLIVQDKTEYPSVYVNCSTPFNLFDRIIAKITGKKGLFRSSIFEEGGEYDSMVVNNGFWARGFPSEIEGNDGEKESIQFKTSFKKAFESFEYLEPLTWFIDIEGSQQVVRIEKAKHTLQNFIGVRLGELDEVSHEASKSDFFSSIEIGTSKSLEYEEINGLDEPNGMSSFSTHITRNDSTYSIKSEYRFDAVGYELTRRRAFMLFPDTDTSRDSDIWIHDTKVIQTGLFGTDVKIFGHNLWSEYFDQPPTGVYDPASAWNLRLSPMNRMVYGHGYSIIRGLYHSGKNRIRFNSSNANQNLSTKLKGKQVLSENGSVEIKDISRPRIQAEKTMATFRYSQEIENQFLGYTMVNGKPVPNYFGLIEYKENGQLSYGRIVKLDNDEKAKLTMINAKI